MRADCRWLALCAIALTMAGCGEASRPGPSVLLIVMDTVRADRLSSYGYSAPTTPQIDAIAAQGLRFTRVSSTSSWTIPSHASLFTGLFPIVHGATQENTRLGAEPATLSELLAEAGYETFAASGNPLVSERSGLSRGFANFIVTAESPGRPAERHAAVQALKAFLSQLGPDDPFFAFVNLNEAHGPYQPPEPFRSRFLRPGATAESVAEANGRGILTHYNGATGISPRQMGVLSDLYDGEVAYVDALVGSLVAALRHARRLEDTIVIVTADHGEHFGEDGHYRHVFSLHPSVVHVPLVIRLPGAERAGTVLDDPASLADVFPTVLSATGVSIPAGRDSTRDLLGPRQSRPVFSEYYYPAQALAMFTAAERGAEDSRLREYERRLRAVEDGPLRLIRGSDGSVQLFDLGLDPDARSDLASQPAKAGQVEALGALLDAYVEAGGGDPPMPEGIDERPFGELDAETEARLRELGYVR